MKNRKIYAVVLAVAIVLSALTVAVSGAPSRFTRRSRTSSVAAAAQITEADAKSAALAHAGVAEADATFTKTKLGYDDGVLEYDVEFYTAAAKYDYEIDAATGKINEYDVEKFKTTPSTSPTAQITEADAKAAALAHANVAEADATFTKTKLDYDDGVLEYDVEFHTAAAEYDYEIDAATGAVNEFNYEPFPAAPSSGTGVMLTADEAKAIALGKAKLDEASVRALKVKLDNDDGMTVYEVEFKNGAVEYELEIDAYTGAILEYDVETDD